MNQADLIASKHKKTFPLVDYNDLKSAATIHLLANAGADPGLQWERAYYRTQDFAYDSMKHTLMCDSEALEYLELSTPDDSPDILRYDCSLKLSNEALQLVDTILDSGFEDSKNSYDKLSMRSIRDGLVEQGWPERRARKVLDEIKDFWRDYVSG